MYPLRTFCPLIATVFLTVIPAASQTRSSAVVSTEWKAGPVSTALDRLEKQADTFEDRIAEALDHSSYDHNTRESLRRWADMVEDEIDDMAKEFKHDNQQKFMTHFSNAMLAASAIDRAMLRKDFSSGAESTWADLRQDLNHIATQLHRPVLPNTTVLVIRPVTASSMVVVPVKQVMEQLEASTDRFEDSLKKSLHNSTANMTRRERVWNDWADYLEDSSDDLLKEYKHNDPAEFQRDLERTLMVGEALNRLMLRSDLQPETNAEWKVVRGQLNTIATAFGYPVLTDLIYQR